MGDSGLATIDVQRTHVTSLVHNERHRWPARGHAPLHYQLLLLNSSLGVQFRVAH